jgi:hypothetical protein
MKNYLVAAKLTVLNTRGSAFKLKSSGKEVSTDKASRADAKNKLQLQKIKLHNQVQNHIRSGYR